MRRRLKRRKREGGKDEERRMHTNPDLKLDRGVVYDHSLRQEGGWKKKAVMISTTPNKLVDGISWRGKVPPMVLSWNSLNLPFTKRITRVDLPTPDSPKSTSLWCRILFICFLSLN
jgi:hypothetical protein